MSATDLFGAAAPGRHRTAPPPRPPAPARAFQPRLPPWWPECPLCRLPVERIAVTMDPDGATELRFTCHGAEERHAVRRHEVDNGAVYAAAFARTEAPDAP